jgi:predicted extracellular nuclease
MKSSFRSVSLIGIIVILAAAFGGVTPAKAETAVFINEIHYDNVSTDAGEAVEIAGPAGTDLTGWNLVLYNGSNGTVYNTTSLPSSIPDLGDGFGVVFITYPTNGLQNGSPDGLALVDNGGIVVQFLSYEGTFTAVGGPADGLTSTDIGVSEGGGTAVGDSLQITGAGTTYEDFVWAPAVPNTFGAINTGQSFGSGEPPTPPPVTLTSIYDIQYTTDPSGDSPYEGQTVTTQGVVTAFFYDEGNRYTFIQEGTGPWSGLVLYSPNGFVNVGDLVEVEGTVSEYWGLTEIANGDVTVLGSSPVPAPELLASGDVSQEQWESVLVRVENVTVTNDDLGYGEWLVDDTSGGVRIDDLGSYGYAPNNSDLLDYVQGPLNYSHSDFKIEPRDDDDIGIAPQLVTICEIQGSGFASPYAWQTVRTQGVVFADFDQADNKGFFIQDEDCDGDPATSDGLFVYKGNNKTNVVSAGDLVEVRGTVKEYYNLTEISASLSNITVLSYGNPLPIPVVLLDLPNESIPEGSAFWEPLEGMYVLVENGFVVAPTSRYGEFALVTDLDADEGSGYYPQTKQIIVRDLGGGDVDYNPERILVDNASLDTPIVVMPGDRVRSLTGAVDYNYSNYKLQPIEYEVKTHKLPKLPASTRSGPNGNLVITTFNVENLFDLEENVSVVVDVIGQVGFRPIPEWGSGDTSTKDNTIRRMPAVCEGDTTETDEFDPILEWDGFPTNTFDGLGAHTVTCAPSTDLIISEYVEGSSYNKAIEIYNGTGDTVNLGAQGYAVEIYFNGKTYPGQTINLYGTLADGDVFVLAHLDADSAILVEADQISGGVQFNGDDAVVLRKGGKDDGGSTPTAAELETQLAKLALAIEVELELPEIIVVQEVENTAILQELGDRVNAANGTSYVATSYETSDARGIEVGFLWDVDRVTLLDAYQMAGSDVEAAFGHSSASPGREPLVGVFEANGEEITIIGNHFKSKGGDDPLFGMNWPPIRKTEAQRKLQAQVVRDFVDTILDADALVMVTGDLNDFQFGEPGEGLDHPIAILEGGPGEVALTNLINLEKDAERWTYVYDGNSQVLDHMLVSPALLDLLVGTDVLHFNAGFPYYLGADDSTPLRSSDHDALEGRFKIK